MDFDTSKNIGGIGAILLVIGPLVVFGTAYASVLGLIGIILVLIAMKGLGDYYKEGGIFNNALYGFIVTIIGGVAAVGALVASFIIAFTTIGFDWTNWAEWATEFQQGVADFSILLTLLGAIIIAIVVLFIFAIIAAILYRKSFNLLATKSGVGMFSTAGLILLIGAVLTIIVIGFLIIWISFILLAVAFFSLKKQAAEQPPAPPPS